MASSGDRRLDDPDGARFFKIIRQETVRDKKILIPGWIVENCGEGLLDSVVLEVPSGLTWTVDVVRDEAGVWLRNGWQSFAEFHSVKYGHFLVFQYKGCSSFYVVICDTTATEIEYPITRTACNQQPADEVGKLFPEPKVEVIDDFSGEVDAPQRNKGKSAVEVAKSNCKKETKKTKIGNSTRNGKVKMELCNEQSALGLGSNSELGLEEEESGDKMGPDAPPFVRKRKPLTGFTSPHPFFDTRITSSWLQRRKQHVPLDFLVAHIGKDEKSVKLQIADKTWPVGLLRMPSEKSVQLSRGWHIFAEENSLKPGDICIFECIRRWTNVLLKVTIIRES